MTSKIPQILSVSTTVGFEFDTYLLDASNNSLVIVLAPIPGTGATVRFKRIDLNSANTIQLTSTQLIDSVPTIAIPIREEINLVALNNTWYIISDATETPLLPVSWLLTGNIAIPGLPPGQTVSVGKINNVQLLNPIYAIISCNDNPGWIFVVNIDNKSAPFIVNPTTNFVRISTGPNGIRLSGSILYVATTNGRIVSINVANPLAIVQLQVLTVASPNRLLTSLEVVGNFLYAAGNQTPANGLFILNVTNPSAMTIVASAVGGILAIGVAVIGDRAYVSTSSGQLVVFNVSNPAIPTIVATLALPSPGGGIRRHPIEPVVYINSSSNNDLYAIDVSNPVNPILRKTVSVIGGPTTTQGSIRFVGNFMLSNGTNRYITFFDVSTPTNPIPAINYDTEIGAMDTIDVDANYNLFIGDRSGNRFKIFTPTELFLWVRGIISTEYSDVNGVRIGGDDSFGRFLFVDGDNGDNVLAEPDNPIRPWKNIVGARNYFVANGLGNLNYVIIVRPNLYSELSNLAGPGIKYYLYLGVVLQPGENFILFDASSGDSVEIAGDGVISSGFGVPIFSWINAGPLSVRTKSISGPGLTSSNSDIFLDLPTNQLTPMSISGGSFRLRSATQSGNISLTDVSSINVELDTLNGSIDSLNSVTGSIKITQLNGNLLINNVGTSNGTVAIKNSTGVVQVINSGTSRLHLNIETGNEIILISNGGDIEIFGECQSLQRLQFTLNGGTIRSMFDVQTVQVLMTEANDGTLQLRGKYSTITGPVVHFVNSGSSDLKLIIGKIIGAGGIDYSSTGSGGIIESSMIQSIKGDEYGIKFNFNDVGTYVGNLDIGLIDAPTGIELNGKVQLNWTVLSLFSTDIGIMNASILPVSGKLTSGITNRTVRNFGPLDLEIVHLKLTTPDLIAIESSGDLNLTAMVIESVEFGTIGLFSQGKTVAVIGQLFGFNIGVSIESEQYQKIQVDRIDAKTHGILINANKNINQIIGGILVVPGDTSALRLTGNPPSGTDANNSIRISPGSVFQNGSGDVIVGSGTLTLLGTLLVNNSIDVGISFNNNSFLTTGPIFV